MPEHRLQTPVAFLIYNRPETTERVFAQIAQAQPRQLLVVADGPRSSRASDVDLCAAARAVVERVDWDCRVLSNYADTNLGCKQRVSSGLDWVFDNVEEAIILEDDCLPHPDFFPFCQALLDTYRADERVMMVGGTNGLRRIDVPASYIFSRYFAIWGWASWRRAWQKYQVDIADWETLKAQKILAYYYPQRYMVRYLEKAFDAAYRHQVDTWDVQWFYCCLFNNALSIVPRANLISNIGLLGTHTLPGRGHVPEPVWPLSERPLQHPARVYADGNYDQALFEKHFKLSVWERARRKIAVLRRDLRSPRASPGTPRTGDGP